MSELLDGVKFEEQIPNFIFFSGKKEVLKITSDGEFYVNGNLVTKDIEVYEGFVDFLRGQGCYNERSS